MSGSAFAIVETTRDRATAGRGVLVTLMVIAVTGGLLLHDLGRAAAPVVEPPTLTEGGGHRLTIPSDARGQCHVAALVNGALIEHLLLDSGASAHLTFGRNHAAQLGYDPANLSYSYTYSSANGVGHYASVRVREFRVASFVLRDVPADITDAPQDEPLIGIKILRALSLQLKNGNCELSVP
jgi:clan AA aspartic protease (TIGR02281 family)